jgi:hypothetical protein
LLSAAWLFGCNADNEGDGEPRRFAPDQVPDYAQWKNVQGVWIVHPPRDAVRDLIGDDAVDVCEELLRDGATRCRAESSCLDVMLYASGNSQVTFSGEGCAAVLRPTEWKYTLGGELHTAPIPRPR